MNPFDDPSMAAGYARARPALHPLIVGKLRARLTAPVRRALDLGCGAGLSTAPLVTFCDEVTGLEPAVQMLPWAKQTAPGARFIAARAEALPVRDQTADLVTAAGSLNYVHDLSAAFAEIRRVLRPAGVLAVYDFSAGREFADSGALSAWFDEFCRRYPPDASEAIPLNPEILAGHAPDLQPLWSEQLLLELPMTGSACAEYMLTETNVAQAVRRGMELRSIREWIVSSLKGVFGEQQHTVRFCGYISCFGNRG